MPGLYYHCLQAEEKWSTVTAKFEVLKSLLKLQATTFLKQNVTATHTSFHIFWQE